MSEEENNREFLTVTFQLDRAHAEMYRQLDDAGFDVSEIVSADSKMSVEQTIYNTFQASKYENEQI